MTVNKLYTSLPANHITAKQTYHVQQTRLDSEDDYHTDSRNVSHQQQFFSELHTPGRSHYTNYWYSWVQTIYFTNHILSTAISTWNWPKGFISVQNACHLLFTYYLLLSATPVSGAASAVELSTTGNSLSQYYPYLDGQTIQSYL